MGGSLVTVDAILTDLRRFDGLRCHDPMETEYRGGDPRIACVYANPDSGTPTIYSHAHGDITHFLEPSPGSEFTDGSAEPGRSPKQAVKVDNLTDAGNATRFAREHHESLRYVGGRWHAWDGRRWATCDEVRVDQLGVSGGVPQDPGQASVEDRASVGQYVRVAHAHPRDDGAGSRGAQPAG